MEMKKAEPQTDELQWLRMEVERKMDKHLASPTDFNRLTLQIQLEQNEYLSVSTIKRLWGYVGKQHAPRISTLDILARFTGNDSWVEFCNKLIRDRKIESSLFSTDQILSSQLCPGDRIELAWNPDRKCVIEYLGDNSYKVVSTVNAKIKSGDTFSTMFFNLNQPLIVTSLHHNGVDTGSYIAGKTNGLTTLRFLGGKDGEEEN